jgi:hypothetical protein
MHPVLFGDKHRRGRGRNKHTLQEQRRKDFLGKKKRILFDTFHCVQKNHWVICVRGTERRDGPTE